MEKRLATFISSKNLSINAFEGVIDVATGSIAKTITNNKGLGSAILKKIILKYPELNLDWLFTGEGEMLKNSSIPLLENENVVVKSSSECSSETKTKNTGLQNDSDSTFLILENEKRGVKTGSEAGSETKNKNTLPVFNNSTISLLENENVNLICKPESKPATKTENTGLQNGSDGTILISGNEKPVLKTSTEASTETKTKNSLVVFGQNEGEGRGGVATGLIRVPIMDIGAGASTQGYLPQGYIDEKHTITLPSGMLQPNRQYVCFQVRGESMLPTLHNLDYVIAYLIQPFSYQDIKSNSIHAIVSKEQDFIIKRVHNHLIQGYLLCVPDSIYHPAIRVQKEDILQIFEVVARLSFHLEAMPFVENIERILNKK